MLQKFDERNRNLIVNISGKLVHRDEAGVSPFDSAVRAATRSGRACAFTTAAFSRSRSTSHACVPPRSHSPSTASRGTRRS